MAQGKLITTKHNLLTEKDALNLRHRMEEKSLCMLILCTAVLAFALPFF